MKTYTVNGQKIPANNPTEAFLTFLAGTALGEPALMVSMDNKTALFRAASNHKRKTVIERLK